MILIPVKKLQNAKQRLSAALDAGQRQALARAMVEDVLATVAACRNCGPVAVITGDEHARALARRYDLEVIEDAVEPGESGAVEMATRACQERGIASTLVLPGDIPLIRREEVEAVFEAAPAEGVVLVPSSDGRGSNAVLRRPAGIIPLRFGDDSFVPHREAARATGRPCIVLSLPGIGLDVDTPEDLARLIEAEGDTRAQRLARSWDLAARTEAERYA